MSKVYLPKKTTKLGLIFKCRRGVFFFFFNLDSQFPLIGVVIVTNCYVNASRTLHGRFTISWSDDDERAGCDSKFVCWSQCDRCSFASFIANTTHLAFGLAFGSNRCMLVPLTLICSMSNFNSIQKQKVLLSLQIPSNTSKYQ